MKLSIVNGERREPEKGLLGNCIGCEQPMIAKCGPIKIWHWAHKSSCVCDHWWENETEWHRNWKNNFPIEWQEIRHRAENGDWHIADVKTNQGHTIEFQHSFLKQEERQSRNKFYGSNLIWVVDGLKRKNDRSHFELALKEAKQIAPNLPLIQLQPQASNCPLLRDWSECTGFVFFDFGMDFPLWCLLPKSSRGHQYLLPYIRQNFVALHKELLNGRGYSDLEKYLNDLVFAFENPQQIQPQQTPVINRPSPQRQIAIAPSTNVRALYNYITRPPQTSRRRFRF